jgi:hypothetical protein
MPSVVLFRIQRMQRGDMSIHSTGARRSKKYNVQRTVAVVHDPAPTPSPAVSMPPPPEAKLRRGNANAYNRLLSSTIDWIASLPPHARPLALATKFPRVANRIAQEWKEPSNCRRDFDELVYDNRGNRKGFPPDVLGELLALRDYYYGYDLTAANEA